MSFPAQEQYFEKTLKSCATFLARWQGADVVMWELTSSHKSLRLVLSSAARPGNLVLSCLEPVSIRGLVRWTNSNMRVTRVKLPDGTEDGFSVTDDAGLEIICGGVEVSENVKLYSS